MNQMQQMLMQANKMQRELLKAHEVLDAKTFHADQNGMVEIEVKGNKEIVSVKIDAEALSPDNKEMLEEAIALAYNKALKEIQKEADAIDEKITGKSGLPF